MNNIIRQRVWQTKGNTVQSLRRCQDDKSSKVFPGTVTSAPKACPPYSAKPLVCLFELYNSRSIPKNYEWYLNANNNNGLVNLKNPDQT